jgi:cellulose synthase/poly-beta-1,6-N-acetylglucosamine synthase-like glycosyltransferase
MSSRRSGASSSQSVHWSPGILLTVPPAAPQISVVLPCLNEGAVGTVVNQAWDDIDRSGLSVEVIVVDNGSSDRSVEVAAAHGAEPASDPEGHLGDDESV